MNRTTIFERGPNRALLVATSANNTYHIDHRTNEPPTITFRLGWSAHSYLVRMTSCGDGVITVESTGATPLPPFPHPTQPHPAFDILAER